MRRASLAALIVVAVTLAAATSACSQQPTRVARPPGTAPAIRVMTYNVNFGIPGDAPTVEAIAAGRADVVFLQETTEEWEEALRAELAATYPRMFFRHWGGAGGLGVLSRLPLRTTEMIRPEGE